MKRLALALSLLATSALAQSNPGFVSGQVPTAGQWNSYFTGKQDYSPNTAVGPGTVVAGHIVKWGSYPALVDGGAPVTLTAGNNVTITGGPAYTVNSTLTTITAGQGLTVSGGPAYTVGLTTAPVTLTAGSGVAVSGGPAYTISASPVSAPANTVRGNFSGSPTPPSDNTVPACADAGGNHLNYVAGSGLVCGTSSAAGSYVERAYLAGLGLSTAGGSATFSIAPGVAADTGNVFMIPLATNTSKTTGAWTGGAGGGCLDTGAVAGNAWYHIFLIRRPDTQTVDVACSTSVSAPATGSAIPAAYTQSRRIGAMRTNGSAQWTAFVQNGDEFQWVSPPQDINTTVSTTPVNFTLTVPPGIKVSALFNATAINGSSYMTWFSPDNSGITSSGYTAGANMTWNGGAAYGGGAFAIRTNTSGQVSAVAGSVTNVSAFTTGWVDRRGRDN